MKLKKELPLMGGSFCIGGGVGMEKKELRVEIRELSPRGCAADTRLPLRGSCRRLRGCICR